MNGPIPEGVVAAAIAMSGREADIRTILAYVELEKKKADLEAQLDVVKAQISDMKEPVLAFFQQNGIDRTSLNGRTLYLKRELWCGRVEGKTSEDAVAALRERGYEEFAKESVNTQGMSALMRERDKDGKDPVPEDLRDVFCSNEVFKVISRAS